MERTGMVNGYIPEERDFTFVSLSEEDMAGMESSGETSFLREAFLKFVSKKGNVAAVIVLMLLVILSLIGPSLSGFVFNEINTDEMNVVPGVSGHIFGTDALGRDMFCRCFRGLRISLFVAVVSTLINVVIGVTLGMISGYFGGAVDMTLQRIMDVLGSIPDMVVLTLLILVLKPGVVTLIFAFILTGWISMSRIARAETLRIKEMEFVLASKTLGAGGFFIVFKNILPNILGPVISKIMVAIPGTIFMESALSVMGLGISSGEVSLGLLIQSGLLTFFLHPHRLIPPIIIMILTIICFNRLADGLRNAFDPQEVL